MASEPPSSYRAAPEPPTDIDQGDIFPAVDIVLPRGGHNDYPHSDVIIVSHSCEYTKVREAPGATLLVAPLRDLAAFGANAEQIQLGKVIAQWALPVEDPITEALVADFRLIQPVSLQQLEKDRRRASLSEEIQDELQARLILFLTRRRFT